MPRRVRYVPLVLLLAVVVEIVVFVLLGRAVGFGPTVMLMLVASVAGLFLLRREGTRAWRGFRAAARAGQPPGRQVTDGLVGLAAGLLLAVPGLVSAVVGLLLVVPPVRQVVRGGVERAAERRVPSTVAGEMFGPRRVRVRRGEPDTRRRGSAGEAAPQGAPTPGRPPVPGVVDGSVVEGEIVDR